MSRVPQRVLRLDAEMAVPWMGFRALLLVSVTRVSLGAADGTPCQQLVAVLENDLEIVVERGKLARRHEPEGFRMDGLGDNTYLPRNSYSSGLVVPGIFGGTETPN